MELLHIILPVLIGAIIGYCTNYIAIKMLFHPRKEIRVGGWKLPFTPGVIPKNQPRIAKAVGNAVGEKLFTTDDLMEELQNGTIKETFVRKTTEAIMCSETPLRTLCETGDIAEGAVSEKVGQFLSQQIVEEIEKADLQPIIKEIAQNSLEDFLKNPMIAMFLNESLLNSIYDKMSDAIKDYVREKGNDAIEPLLVEKIDGMMEKSLGKNLSVAGIEDEVVQSVLGNLFDTFVTEAGPALVEAIDISNIVQQKIEEMDVEDLENLVMSVMKQELQSVINLGALIGAVIGIVNIFV